MSLDYAPTVLKDREQAKKELLLRLKLRDNFRLYASRMLRIQKKEGGDTLFRIKRAQQHLHTVAERQRKKRGFVRIVVVKGRQQGCSTYIEGRFYWRVSFRKKVNAFILTHHATATSNLFKMAKYMHEHVSPKLRPATGSDSNKELSFKHLASGYAVGTAGTAGVGRSGNLQYFHGSEVAYWPNASDHATGILQSIARAPGTEVWLESTANGIGNYFHSQYRNAERGLSDFEAVFLPWYWQDEYKIPVPDDFVLNEEERELLEKFGPDGLTTGHLGWRRIKTAELAEDGDDGSWRFRQEYPFTSYEAFNTSSEDSMILPRYVLNARGKDVEAFGPKVVGLDIARKGPDSTVFAYRQGSEVYQLNEYKETPDTMKIVSMAAAILKNVRTGKDTDIEMMFIDVGGVGGGVYDRLVELGFGTRLCPVDSGTSPTLGTSARLLNKRAEMWYKMREWFQTNRVSIPDDDDLQGQVCGPKYEYQVNTGCMKVESKKDMRTRKVPSPDKADAIALTFAEPVIPRHTGGSTSGHQVLDEGVGY